MIQEKLAEIRKKMLNHTIENDIAIVKLTAFEVHFLLELADKAVKKEIDLSNYLANETIDID